MHYLPMPQMIVLSHDEGVAVVAALRQRGYQYRHETNDKPYRPDNIGPKQYSQYRYCLWTPTGTWCVGEWLGGDGNSTPRDQLRLYLDASIIQRDLVEQILARPTDEAKLHPP